MKLPLWRLSLPLVILVAAAAFLFGLENTQAGSVQQAAFSSFFNVPPELPPQQENEQEETGRSDTTADHSKFDLLQGPFQTGPDVTRACLTCHTEAAKQIQKTIHWSWECQGCPDADTRLGKKHVVNNFCMGLGSNEPRCTSCHIGYGWTDKSFDFSAEERVDCLVCHDTTGTYKKFPTGAGHPVYEPTEFKGKLWDPPDLTLVAQNVGRPGRSNCGSCHFFGGGGAGVKHGSLDSSLTHPDHEVDVHMAEDGPNFECVNCHQAPAHNIQGSRLRMSISDDSAFALPLNFENRANCISCHGPSPMNSTKLNDHVDRVACQTCHIPTLARGRLPTKLYWDWSEAGRLDENGKPVVEMDENGVVTYDGKKGSFVWAKDVPPEYVWSNGIIRYLLPEDKIDDTGVVQINFLEGSYDDPNARIFPVKVHRGKQPYDSGHKNLVIPHLFGKDEAAYWKSYDWDQAIAAGMAYLDLPYSGQYDFVETEMFWPATHMVAPVEEALACESCHTRTDSRLAALTDFYLIGRDRHSLLDRLGWLVVGASLLGVVIHSSVRVISYKTNHNKQEQEQ